MKILQTNNLTGITEEIEVEEMKSESVDVIPIPTVEERLQMAEDILIYVLMGGM